MTSKRLSTLLVLLALSISAFGQPSAYPRSKGAVSDYVGKLDGAQIEELTGIIETYKQQTSIEFAVIVVGSLQGESAREYAEGIGDSWGVGQAGRDNGIVLLWAPNERKYSLRIADGLSADLSNEDAERITRENLLPNFKREEYYAGLKETVVATMQQLGGKSWEERLQARAQAAQQRREEQRSDLWIAAGVVATIVLAALIAFALYRWRQRKQKLAEMADASTLIAENLRAARENAPKIQQLLSDLSQQAPEQDIKPLTSDLAAQPGRILDIEGDAARVNFTDLESYDEVLQIRDRAATEDSLLGSMQERVAEIKSARERSRTLMEQLSRQSFEIAEVRDSSKRGEVDHLLSQSRQMYEQARQDSSLSVFDWLIINNLLNSSHNQVQQAVEVSQAVPYVPSVSSSNNDSNDSSSSFGGDSGSFGGGGGFSTGSGSDGSY
jgi:uncharacterized protein